MIRFRLRTVFFATTIAAVGVAFVLRVYRNAAEQREIVAGLDGTTGYDCDYCPDETYFYARRNALGDLLRKSCGTDTVNAIAYAHVDSPTAETLSQLARLPELRVLTLEFLLDVESSELAKLNGLGHLKDLDIRAEGRSLSFADFAPLVERLVNLRTANLGSDTDIDAAHTIAQATRLRVLALQSCQSVDDKAVAALVGHPSLEELDLSRTAVSAKGVYAVLAGTNVRHLLLYDVHLEVASTARDISGSCLEELDVSSATLDDAILGTLAQLPRLRVLRMPGANISDASMQHLRAFRHLEHLNISDTKISIAGIAALVELKRLRYLCAMNTDLDGDVTQYLIQMGLKEFCINNGTLTKANLQILRDHGIKVSNGGW